MEVRVVNLSIYLSIYPSIYTNYNHLTAACVNDYALVGSKGDVKKGILAIGIVLNHLESVETDLFMQERLLATSATHCRSRAI